MTLSKRQAARARQQTKKHWRAGKYTAIYLNRGLMQTIPVNDPKDACAENLIAICTGDMDYGDFMETIDRRDQRAKLTVRQVRRIREQCARPPENRSTVREIAKRNGISAAQVSRVANETRWRNI